MAGAEMSRFRVPGFQGAWFGSAFGFGSEFTGSRFGAGEEPGTRNPEPNLEPWNLGTRNLFCFDLITDV